MKKIIACVLSAIMAFFAVVPALTVVALESTDEKCSAKTAEAYLTEAAFKQYLYEPRNLDQYTIKSVSQETVAEKSAAYSRFRAGREQLLYEDTRIATGDVDELLNNLELHEKSIAYYAHLGQLSNSLYKFFKPSYNIVRVETEGDLAIAELYEVLDFQYVELDDTSMVMTHFFISLLKNDGRWYVMAVESDDLFYEAYRETGVDLEQTLEDIDAIYEMNEQDTAAEPEPEGDRSQAIPSPDAYDLPYNQQNAVNYALTYTRGNSDNGMSGPSTWANTNFYHTPEGQNGADCQRFASECIWAGLGGSNTTSQINAKQTMDNQGTTARKWFGTTSVSGQCTQWTATSLFSNYVTGVDVSGTETDLLCKVSNVANNEWNLCNGSMVLGTGALSQGDLLGSELLVKGGSNGNPTALGHAVIITKVNGTSRSQVYFTAYNQCYRNARLSVYKPASSSSYDKIRVIVPQYLRNGNPTGGDYLYGDLLPALANGVTRTVVGRASNTSSTLKLKVYNPSNVLVGTATTNQATSVSKSIIFSGPGIWRVVVTGGTLVPYTFTVRVAQYQGELTNDPAS